MTEQQNISDNPLRDVALNPEAYAQYLTEVQRVARDLLKGLDTLEGEVSVHLRGTHVEGDRWYHARSRARHVEKPLRDAIKGLEKTAQGLEKAAFQRRTHDDQVRTLPEERRQKALAKEQKKNPAPQIAPNSGNQNPEPVPGSANTGYSEVTSILDARGRESA